MKSMAPFFDQDHLALRAHVRAWVQENWDSLNGRVSDVEEEARRLVRLLGQSEILAYVIPKRFGGQREKVQARDICILREELGRLCAYRCDVRDAGVGQLSDYAIRHRGAVKTLSPAHWQGSSHCRLCPHGA